MDKKTFVKYLRTLGIEVHATTKARGHHGFFCKNRIDISKDTPEYKVIPTMMHEFAHYIHYQLEPDMPKNGGSFQVLFKSDSPLIEAELFKVTNFVDENSLCVKLYEHKDRIKNLIKDYEKIIKSDYPGFMRSKKFKEFDKYIKKSEAKYLLKYDCVRLVGGFWRKKYRVISVSSIEKDFPDMPRSFSAYIKLRSCQKKQKRISARISRLQKYYKKPTELFARFLEGLYMDKEWVFALAPYTTGKFIERLDNGCYKDLEGIRKLIL